MKQKMILGVKVENQSKSDILEKINKYLKNPKGFFHIVSVNPENITIASKLNKFKEVVNTAQIRIIDGVGVVLAARMLGFTAGPRLTGVDLMERLMFTASNRPLRVLLIGGKGNLAEELADCYNKLQSKANFKGFEGIKDIQNPDANEEKTLISIVADYKPHLMFVSFGSPFQELWIYKNRSYFNGIVCMGVGGAFDFLAGTVRRAPKIIRSIGLEWLYRLITQPWRLKRQVLRLPYFLLLVFKERLARKA